MTKNDANGLNARALADQLYYIALDPESLDTFIEAWNEAGLDSQDARRTLLEIDQFDTSYQAHLKRAELFLSRAGDPEDGPDLEGILAPFDSLAAFIVDRKLEIAACNAGARLVFGIEDDLSLNAMNLPREARATVADTLLELFRSGQQMDQLLKIEFSEQNRTSLFQFRKLNPEKGVPAEHILVVTTRFHWQAALGQTLEEVFRACRA
jgi:hypothetical protein